MTLRSEGFEIETELTSEAVARRLRVLEISILYHPRIAGTQSKLRAYRDGLRILATIVAQSIRLRPHRTMLFAIVPCAILALTVHWAFAVAGGLIAMTLWSLFLMELRSRPRGNTMSR